MTPVRIGELLYLHEGDYRYGRGRLWLRVTAIIDTTTDPDWIQLRGIQLAWNGARLAERTAWVRTQALTDPKTSGQ